MALRLALYQRGVFRVRRAERPVISVGNVAAGGTGKTPFVRWLAGELLARDLRPSILTRGYGRSSRGTVVVSNGAGRVASVRDSGDEAAVLARALPRIPIVAASRRLAAAARVEADHPDVTAHLLDDGFSHLALSRDLDIVLVDATAPDAGGDLLPAGRLREPLASLARADLIVVTKCEQASPEVAHAILEAHAPGVPVYHAATRVLGIADEQGQPVSTGDLPPGTLVAVAGLARPEAFFSTIGTLGLAAEASLPFPDHARFGDFQVGRILRAVEETGASAVITTEKDAVKLDGRLRLPVFRVAVDMPVTETGFVVELLARLARRPS